MNPNRIPHPLPPVSTYHFSVSQKACNCAKLAPSSARFFELPLYLMYEVARRFRSAPLSASADDHQGLLVPIERQSRPASLSRDERSVSKASAGHWCAG